MDNVLTKDIMVGWLQVALRPHIYGVIVHPSFLDYTEKLIYEAGKVKEPVFPYWIPKIFICSHLDPEMVEVGFSHDAVIKRLKKCGCY